jgi:Protein of unknown function (DUF2934)
MNEPDSSMTQARGKSGKAKAVFKRNRSEAPSGTRSRQAQEFAGDPSTDQEQASSGQDAQVIARIQQRAYWLYETGGFEHGHDLEHWLEAERQVTGSSRRPADNASTEPD